MKKVDRISVSCQTNIDEEILEEEVGRVSTACQASFEPEGIEDSGAIWVVAQLKALLEEEMVTHNDSSGYESNLSSLEDEENDDDISSKSNVLSVTTSSCEDLVPICESTQLVLGVYNEEQQEEEQLEVFREEDLLCAPDCDQAEGESECGAELAEAPAAPQPLPGWLPGVSSGVATCRPGPTNPDWRVRPPNLGWSAESELEPWPSIFWPCSCFSSYTGPCCNWGAQSP